MAVKFLLMVVVLAATMDVTLSKPHAVQLENTEESDDGYPCKRMSSFSEVEKRVFRRSPAECWRWSLFKKKCNRRCTTTSAATKSPKPVPAATRPMKVREEDTKKRTPPRSVELVEQSEENDWIDASVEATKKSTTSSTPNNPQTGNRPDSDENTTGTSSRGPVPQTDYQDEEMPQGDDPNVLVPSQPPLPTESTPSLTEDPKNDFDIIVPMSGRAKPVKSTSTSTPYYSGKVRGNEPNAATITSKPTVNYSGIEDMGEDEPTKPESDNEELEENETENHLEEINVKELGASEEPPLEEWV